MAYPKQFLKLSWLFKIDATEEIAETSANISTVGTSPYDAVAALALMNSTDADTISGALVGMVNGSNFLWGDYSRFDSLKVAAIGTDGHYLDAPQVWPFPGHVGTHNNIPPQDTLVLSLRSGLSFGDANFGRMYIPHTMAALDTGTARMTAAKASLIAGDFDTFISTVNLTMDSQVAGSGVVILSQKGAGTVKAPLQVGCGRVIDTQRRRRNRLDEDTQLTTI